MERLFVECAVRAALIAVVTAIVLRAIGVKPAAARHTAWTCVMLTMLLLPVWTAWGPKASVRLLPPEPWRETILTRSVTTSNAPQPIVLPHSVSQTAAPRVGTSGPHRAVQNWNWQILLLVVYGLGAFGLLARLGNWNRPRESTDSPDERPGWQGDQFRVRVSSHGGMASSGCDFARKLPGMVGATAGCGLDARTRTRSPARSFDPVAGSREPRCFLVPSAFLVVGAETFTSLPRRRATLPCWPADTRRRTILNTSWTLPVPCYAPDPGWASWEWPMPGSFLQQRILQILTSCEALRVSRTRIAVAVAACAVSSALLASGTLDHARAHVQPGTNGLVHSS